MKRIIPLLWLVLLTLWVYSSLVAQTLTDTLWSVASLDGSISYRPALGTYRVLTSSLTITPGDGYDVFLGAEYYARGFLSFRLTDLNHIDSLPILQAVTGIYQFDSFGNNQQGVYPIWNVAGGDTHFCVLDHVDYGINLDLGDWTAGDPGDSQTLQTNIGIISSDTTIEYKTMEVTPYVKEDIANQRSFNQYRMRFTIDTDFDGLGDLLIFRSGNSIVTKPYLAIQYNDTTTIIPLSYVPLNFQLKQNYPNPFNPTTIISYTLQKTGTVELTIFNSLGKKVQTLVNTRQPAGSYKVQFDGSELSSGIYWYRLKFNQQMDTKKMLLIR